MTRRSKFLADLAGSGDDGSTGTLGPLRVPKDSPLMQALGEVDELSSFLGLARAWMDADPLGPWIIEIQRDLYHLGAELASAPEQAHRFASLGPDHVERLEVQLRQMESRTTMPKEFILTGQDPSSACLDLCRAVARRCERRLVALSREGSLGNGHVISYINRVSLWLFVAARDLESRRGHAAPIAKQGPVQYSGRS